MTEAGLAALLCEGRNHDHEWAICYDSQRLAEFVSARLPSPETTPAGVLDEAAERMIVTVRASHGPVRHYPCDICDRADALAAALPLQPAGVLDEIYPLTESVSPLVDVTHREPVGEAPSQGGVTGSVSCGAVMATCRNEPGHDGDHWHPALNGEVVQ